MVYLTGVSSKEYVINGVLIPKGKYSAREIELGKKVYTVIDDVTYSSLAANKIFVNLTKQKLVIVSDKPPTNMDSAPELRERLREQGAEKDKRITDLEEVIRSMQKDKEHLISREKYEAVQKALEAKTKEFDELNALAEGEIATRNARIEELEKKLEAIKKKKSDA